MNDTKNILIAWISSISTMLDAVDSRTWISIVSAIVLPLLFFAAGKAIDVMLQIHLNKQKKNDDH